MGLKITGTGSSIPKITQENDSFSDHNFYDIDGKKFEIENQTIIEKFKSGEQISIEDLNLDKQLLDRINKFAPIKHILEKKKW